MGLEHKCHKAQLQDEVAESEEKEAQGTPYYSLELPKRRVQSGGGWSPLPGNQ